MVSSSFGQALQMTIGGGSHESEMNLKIQGLPVGFPIRGKKINEIMARRAPGKSPLSTSRKETDMVYLMTDGKLCKITDDTTFQTPKSGVLEFVIKNENHNSKEYQLTLPRPGHADLPAHIKYKDTVNMAGGGPFSGRMTAMYTLAGAISMEILNTINIKIGSSILSVGKIQGEPLDLLKPESSCHGLTFEMEQEILKAGESNDSVGGIIEGYITGLPAGIGGPMFDGIESTLSPLLFAIPAVKAIEFGQGFNSAKLKGSENNDSFLKISHLNTTNEHTPLNISTCARTNENEDVYANASTKLNKNIVNEYILTETNNSGGILGGITTGMPLVLRIAVKPTPSIGKPQKTININTNISAILEIKGRHDPCIVPRCRVVLEAVMAIGILEAILKDDYMSGLLSNKWAACQDTESSQTACQDTESSQTACPDTESSQADCQNTNLSVLRQGIDLLDEQIVGLLNRRMEISRAVARYKQENNVSVKDSRREDEILEKVGDDYKGIYQEIFKASRRLQIEITGKK